jgi:hypothetical protein
MPVEISDQRAVAHGYEVVCQMESDLDKASTLAATLATVAETLDDRPARIVQRLAWEIESVIATAEDKRGALFHTLHPNLVHRHLSTPGVLYATLKNEDSGKITPLYLHTHLAIDHEIAQQLRTAKTARATAQLEAKRRKWHAQLDKASTPHA